MYIYNLHRASYLHSHIEPLTLATKPQQPFGASVAQSAMRKADRKKDREGEQRKEHGGNPQIHSARHVLLDFIALFSCC